MQPTLDQGSERLFKLWQKAGRIPEKYNSWDEVSNEFLELVDSGLSEKEAREAMGITYRNILNKPILKVNESSTGLKRGLDKRAVREDLNIFSENLIREHGGQKAVDQHKDKLLKDWNTFSEGETKSVQRQLGRQHHRGHVIAALEGGSLSQNNMMPELGIRNVAHGSAPRFPQGVIDDMGVPRTDATDYFEELLIKEGLGMDRPNNALAIAADEQMVDFSGKSHQGYMRNNEAGMAPEAMMATQDRLNQLEAQGVSRQDIDTYSRNRSASLATGDSVAQSGPVKVTPGSRQKVKVSTDGGYARPRVVGPGKAPTPPKVTPKAFPNRLIGKAGKALNVPMVGGVIAAGSAIAGGAGPAAAAGAFVDAENPIDGGALADGTLDGAMTRDQVRQIEKENTAKLKQFNNTLSNFTPLGAVKNLANWALNGFGR